MRWIPFLMIVTLLYGSVNKTLPYPVKVDADEIAKQIYFVNHQFYLDNQIYYESRNIAHYQRIKMTLEEEQMLIKNRLEEINYKENLLNSDIK